jgi:hypothetical protein
MAVLSGLASGMSKGSELLRAVMTGTMGPEQGAAKGDLDAVADEPDPNGGADEPVADAIAGAGEAYPSVFVHDPQHLTAFGRLGWTCGAGVKFRYPGDTLAPVPRRHSGEG